MGEIFSFFTNLDTHIQNMILQYGSQTYIILFLIIFCETGLVVTPFLPGDSLLFAIGMFSTTTGEPGTLNLYRVMLLLSSAAIIGDQVNYRIGKAVGPRVFKSDNARIFKRSHLLKTESFFAKYGAKTIVLARFVPIVRTFAPFVAGMGTMSYGKFCAYSVFGAFFWVIVCTMGGYLFGNIPVVKDNFEYGIFAIIGLSILPMVFEYVKHKRVKNTGPA
jgi:membrane-associated protein